LAQTSLYGEDPDLGVVLPNIMCVLWFTYVGGYRKIKQLLKSKKQLRQNTLF